MAPPTLLRATITELGHVIAMRTYKPTNSSPRANPWIGRVRRQTCAEALACWREPGWNMAVMMIERQRRSQEDTVDREEWLVQQSVATPGCRRTTQSFTLARES